MNQSPGLLAYKLGFELSPIILTHGIVENFPGSMLPIIAITESLNFIGGLLSGGTNIDVNDFFANFQPLPGATLIDNAIGTYPFANQAVAANAIITQPLTISLLMMIPVHKPGGYATKLGIMMALQTTLAQHNNSGGTYTIATPSYFYTNCIMTAMRDVSNAQSKQPQNAWQFDFRQPLLTEQQAQITLAASIAKITNGLPTDGALSGIAPQVGFPPGLAAGSVAPVGSGLPGTAVAGSALNGS